MKILKILIIAFLVLVLAAFVGFFIFAKTFDIAKYKPKITEEVAKALGREVVFSDISLKFLPSQGLAVSLKDLSVKDDPNFSKEDFLFIKEINLGVNALSYLATGQLLISQVNIRSPKVVIIRNAKGEINVQSLQKKEGKKEEEGTSRPFSLVSPAYAAETPAKNTFKIPDLLIRAIKLEDGIVSYKDESFSPAIFIEVPQLDVNVDNFSLTETFPFSLEASVFSQGKNISASGKAAMDIAANSFSLKDTKVNCDLSSISIGALEQSLPMLKAAGLEGGVKGTIEATLERMTAGSKGLTSLFIKGSLKEGKAKTKYLPLPFNNITANFEATEKDAALKEASLNLGVGTVSAEGGIQDYLKEQKFSFDIVSSGIDLQQVIAQQGGDVSLEGELLADFTIEGKGFKGDQAMFESLSGDGSLEVKNGKLRGINVLRVVLDKMSMLPGLVEDVEENLPEQYKEQLKSDDTILKKVKLITKVAGGALVIDNSQVVTDLFSLTGNGTLGFDQELDLSAMIAVPKDLSESMATSSPPLQFLLDETGEITIPLSVTGKIPHLAFLPDLEYLGKRIIANRGREELQKVLEDVFGEKEGEPQDPSAPPPTGNEGQGTQPPPEEEKSPEQELINGILDKIFK